jgi:hypothetical protein
MKPVFQCGGPEFSSPEVVTVVFAQAAHGPFPSLTKPTTTFPATSNFAKQSATMDFLNEKLHLTLTTIHRKLGSAISDLRLPLFLNIIP